MSTIKIKINRKWYGEGETVEMKRFIPFTGKRKWDIFYVSQEKGMAVLTSGKSKKVVSGRTRICRS